jgi:hypothetical protein
MRVNTDQVTEDIRTGTDTNTEPNDETTALQQDTVDQEDRSVCVQSALQDEADSHDESLVDESSMRTQSVSQDETGSQNESLVDESSMRTQSASQDEEGSQNEQSVGAQSDNDTESEIIETEVLNEPSTKPGYKTSFEYQLADGQKGQATVLPKLKQPKPTSKFRNWLNVRNVESNKDSSINWDNIVWWKPSCGELVLTVTQIQ